MKKEIEFPDYLRQNRLSARSNAAYCAGVRLFLQAYSEVTVENLMSYRCFLIKNYRPSSINQRIHALNHYLDFLCAHRQELYPDLGSFRLRPVKIPHKSFRDSVITNEDCARLEQGLWEDGNRFWYFVVRFLVTTGARVSELTQIKVEHLNCGYLDLYSKGGKIRRIYIPDRLCMETRAWCVERGQTTGFLFMGKNGCPVTARGIHSQLKHYALRYGIDPESIYPHSFRHRFAKNFLLRSGDISLLADILGHESIETTRIYLTKSSREQKLLLDELVTW